jgi:hemerythrin-like metal-binding protein
MSVFKWKESYNLNINKIDSQHQKLIDLLNDIYDAMSENKTAEQMQSFIRQLSEYTQNHFTTEENLLSKHAYPDLKEHRKAHLFFIGKIDEFKSRFGTIDFALSIDLAKFLKDWFLNHICVTDKKYAPFLKSKGVI